MNERTPPTPHFGVIFDDKGNVLDAGPADGSGKVYTIKSAERQDTLSLNNVVRINTTDLYILRTSPDRFCYWTPMGWKCR